MNNVDIAKALERPPECELLYHQLAGCLEIAIASMHQLMLSSIDLAASSADTVKYFGCELRSSDQV